MWHLSKYLATDNGPFWTCDKFPITTFFTVTWIFLIVPLTKVNCTLIVFRKTQRSGLTIGIITVSDYLYRTCCIPVLNFKGRQTTFKLSI